MDAIVIQQPETSAVEAEISPIVLRANALVIEDQVGFEVGAELRSQLKAGIKRVEDEFAPCKRKAHEAHKAITALEKKVLDAPRRAVDVVNLKLSSYESDQRRKAEDARRRMEEEARRAEEERRLAEAAALEAAGDTELAEQVLSEPITTPAVVAPPPPRAEGLTFAEIWEAEVVDIRNLCAAIGSGNLSDNLVKPNMVALNGMARAQKQGLRVPGVRVVCLRRPRSK